MAAVHFRLFILVFCGHSLTFATVQNSIPPYQERYFSQLIDHFNFKSFGNKTYQQRYLIQDKWWIPGTGPFFFYTGNEGDITDFWEASGFVHELAPQFGALIIFAEHRYYGKSLPFGDKSFQDQYIGLLTMEQAMADYAILINSLKEALSVPKAAVIAFGGSYGGMLSAYMRFKYPNIITGSLAASAPIFMLDPTYDRSFFFRLVSQDFINAGGNCVNNIRKGFQQMDQVVQQGEEGLSVLSSDFHLCSKLPDSGPSYKHLQGWIRNGFTYLAMLDYPYPTDFMGIQLPANPVQTACDVIDNAIDPIKGLASAAAIYYNIKSHVPPCFNITEDFVECADPTGCGVGPDSWAWDYQACTEITLPEGSNGQSDIFPVLPFTSDMRRDYCQKRWNVVPRDDWSGVQFWGQNIKAASNIIFSNGNLDPWLGGGVLQNLSDSLIAVLVKGGAHHLDLRASNKLDPPGVIEAREREAYYLSLWVNSALP